MLESPHHFNEDARMEREMLRRVILWLVAIATILVGAFFAGRLSAAEVFKAENAQGPVALRLSEDPCTDKKVLAVLSDKVLDDRRFKAAVLTYGGRDWKSCWVEINGAVLSIDEEGAPFQAVPRQMFMEEGV